MEVVRHGEVQDLDAIVGEQVGVVARAQADAVHAVEPGQRRRVGVAYGHELGAHRVLLERRPAADGRRQLATHEAAPDDADADPRFGHPGAAALVDDCPQRAHHAGGVGVLDDVAPVDDAGGALLQYGVGAAEQLVVRHPAPAANEHRHPRRGHDASILRQVVGGVGLDEIGTELGRLPHQRHDAAGVAVGFVSPAARLHHEGLDHQGHPGAIAGGPEGADVLQALTPEVVHPGHIEDVHAHACGIQAHRLADRIVHEQAERRGGRLGSVDVGDVDPKHEGGLVAARLRLQQRRLAGRQLDCIRTGPDEHLDHRGHVLDAGQERRLAEEAVVNRNVDAALGVWMEEAVEAIRGGHGDLRRGLTTLSDHKEHTPAVLIAGPNLTIDRTLTVDELRPGEVLRFDGVAVTPGGKGVNVARVARALGVPALLVGFTPGRTGAAAAGLIADEALALEPVSTGGELRSTAVILERGGRVTVMNEPGPPVGPEDWERYAAAVAAGLEGHGVLVCSGSVPPGTPPDAYGQLTGLAARAGAVTIVDASGPVLGAALQSGPAVVCPNLAEAEGLLHGRPDETVEAGAATEVLQRSVERGG